MKKQQIFTIIVFIAIVIIAVFAVNIIAGKSETGFEKSVTDSVRKTVIACYALEGAYPPDIQYLKDHYGLIVDEEKYIVFYNAFAENVMPDIKVIPIK